MWHIFWRVTVFFLVLLVISSCGGNSLGLITKPEPAKKVVVVVIDGLRYTELDSLRLIPEKIFSEGVFFSNLWINGCINKKEGCAKTNTVNGHAAMTTGFYTIPPLLNDGSEHPPYPTIFEKLIKDKGMVKERVVVSGGKARLVAICWSTDTLYGESYSATNITYKESDQETFYRVDGYYRNYKPHIGLNNFHEVDDVAHLEQWRNYIHAIKTVDTLVCRFYEDLKNMPEYKDMVFILTTDHGRHVYDFHSHGDTCVGCRHIFACIIGQGIQKGVICEVIYEQPQIGVFVAEQYGINLGSSFPSISREDLYISP